MNSLQRKISLQLLLAIPCRLRGDIVQYDITDPEHPKLAGRVWLGGCCRKGGPYKVLFCTLLCLYITCCGGSDSDPNSVLLAILLCSCTAATPALAATPPPTPTHPPTALAFTVAHPLTQCSCPYPPGPPQSPPPPRWLASCLCPCPCLYCCPCPCLCFHACSL